MAMMVDWEYFFPNVYFKHDRFETWSKEDLDKVIDEDGNWDPQKDFEFHMQKLKVDSKYFDEKNKNLFPESFVKNRGKYYLGSIMTFEEARIELLNRVQFSFVEQREKETYNEDLDDYEYEDYPIFKIELLELNKNIEVEKGTIGSGADECTFSIRSKKNVITSHKFNAINILYDWLLSLGPIGSYDNKWQIFAYGVSEYDETLSYVDTFVSDAEESQASIPGFENENKNKIISQSIKTNFKDLKNKKESGLIEELLAEKLHLKTDTATDIRELLKEWNPFI
tara:strand:- start:14245 stop:15090 length:846 start_codon:yes stop_codon:yes gene_type:complete